MSCVHAGNLHPPDAQHNVLNCPPWQACDSAEDAQFVQKFAVNTAVLQLRGVLWVSFLTLGYKVDSCLAIQINHELQSHKVMMSVTHSIDIDKPIGKVMLRHILVSL